ncbi:MAG: cupin domain-containing protein [Streptosporangiaceae bacterium]
MKVLAGAGAFSAPAAGETASWVEHLRVADLSVGTYSIPAGGSDDQSPHTEDEIYLVTTGTAVLESGGARVAVGAGSVIYVPAGEDHHFTEIAADFAAVVCFGPAEYSRTVSQQAAGDLG